MRRPAAKAKLALGLALASAAGVAIAIGFASDLGPDAMIAILLPSGIVLPIAFVFGLMAAAAAVGESRLLGGIGELARWELVPGAWDSFRAYDTRRAAERHDLVNDFVPRPADGRRVEVRIGQRQVRVDDSYHALSPGFMTWVGWTRPPDAPECLEIGLAHPRSEGGAVYTTLRVPVAATARDDGVRIYHHFHALLPKRRDGLVHRRPALVFGWCGAVLLASAAVAAFAWRRQASGAEDEATIVAMVAGIGVTIGTALVALVLGAFLLARRRRRAAAVSTR